MLLYLIRHAEAENGGGPDYARRLTDKGRKQAARLGAWLGELGISPAGMVSSPYARALDTAILVAEALGRADAVRQDERLAPGMTVDEGCALVHELGDAAADLCLFGHAPDLGSLAAYLIGAKEGSVEMKKGAAACVEADRAGFGGSVLKWLVNPKLLG